MDVVLLHGFAGSGFTWRHLAPRLSATHRVVVLDRAPEPVADSVEATLEAAEGAVLVGHSAGAELAVLVAARVQVRGLVLVAPVIGTGPPPLARLAAGLPGMGRLGPVAVRAAALVGFERALALAWVDRTTLTAEVVEGYRRAALGPGTVEAMWAMTRATRPDPDWAALAGVARVVIRGDRDRWATAVPDADEIVYERCGHLPHEEQPDRFAADVEAFLASL